MINPIEGNLDIAKFLKLEERFIGKNESPNKQEYYYNSNWHKLIDLPFHKDWNKLIDLCQFVIKNTKKKDKHFSELIRYRAYHLDIYGVYEAVIYAVRELNLKLLL